MMVIVSEKNLCLCLKNVLWHCTLSLPGTWYSTLSGVSTHLHYSLNGWASRRFGMAWDSGGHPGSHAQILVRWYPEAFGTGGHASIPSRREDWMTMPSQISTTPTTARDILLTWRTSWVSKFSGSVWDLMQIKIDFESWIELWNPDRWISSSLKYWNLILAQEKFWPTKMRSFPV